MPEIFGREAPAFPTRAVIARQALARYGSGYVRLLAHPLDLLAGQLWAFFAVSVYVKLAEMGQTTEYGVAWLGALPPRITGTLVASAITKPPSMRRILNSAGSTALR